MNILRARFGIPIKYLLTLRNKAPPIPPHKHIPTIDQPIQTAPDRLSGQYIESVRQMTRQEIKKPWYRYFGILLMLTVIPTYYLTYKVISADENTFQQQQNIRKAINTYYFRNAFFTSVLAMVAALRFRNPTLVFIEKTNMSVAPFILPLLGCMIGLSLPQTWSNPALMLPAFASEGLLMFLMLTRRSLPVPLMYFKTYTFYYDLFIMIILAVCLWSYHKESKKMQKYTE